MSARTGLKEPVRWLLVVLLTATGAVGLRNLFREWGQAETIGQHGVALGQLVHGVAGLAAGVGLVVAYGGERALARTA